MKIIILFSFLLLSNNVFAYIPITTDARIKTLIYSPTEVFRLKFHHNYQSYIEFPKNEKFEIISLGNRYAWDIKQVANRLFIRPNQEGLLTNMTIITNARPYHFEIESSNKPLAMTDASLVYVAKFYYPETAYDFTQTVRIKKPLDQYNIDPKDKSTNIENPKILSQEPVVNIPEVQIPKQEKIIAPIEAQTAPGASLSYNYNYSLVGDKEEITPLKIYDDGVNTYFEFAGNILPDIYYIDNFNNEIPARYSVNNNIVTVNNIAAQFSLRDNNNVICIFNEKF